MKFSAYMFIRNGIRGGYTFMESIENVLPFVDEFFILEGGSDDGTLEALLALAKLDPKLRIVSKIPDYVGGAGDKKGLLLGAAFEEARRNCDGDWLIQVQADTVFHPAAMLAVRDFLLERGDGWYYDAIEIVREQYRWNWQEMYRKDHLALIFRKNAGKVLGDAINVRIDGKISARFVPLFERFPAVDNAWIFFGNIAGKLEGCREIWSTPENHGEGPEFPWYDKATGRDYRSDLEAYRLKGEAPLFWSRTSTPFRARLPDNLAGLVGSTSYAVNGRFFRSGGVYAPGPAELAALRVQAGRTGAPLREKTEETLAASGFAPALSLARRVLGGSRPVPARPGQSSEAQKGEIEFRAKLSSQQVSGTRIFEDEFDGAGITAILAARMSKTLEQARLLKDSGVALTPYLEIGAERCQRALVLENDLGASGAAADISFDMLKSCAHYMGVFGKAKAPLRVCCDINRLPFLSGSVRFVMCYQTIHHFPDPEPVIKEVLRVLSPGGYFSMNEEPFRKTLHLDLYKGRKMYSKDKNASPGRLAELLDFFFSEMNCNETGHGVIENDKIPLGAWKRALSGFEERRVGLVTVKKIRTELFDPSNRLKYLAAWLFGGEIHGLCRKAGNTPEDAVPPAAELACPSCMAKGLDSGLTGGGRSFACRSCASSFPVIDGVLFLFPAEKFKELYPDAFLKADVRS